MRPSSHCTAIVALAALTLAAPAAAQHDGHAPAGVPDSGIRVSPFVWYLGATPLLTHATPTAGGRRLTEGYVAHPVAMLHASTPRGGLSLQAMLNGEGLTLQRGELATGVFGEGYVDRRHPHAYLHEIVLTGATRAGPVRLSASAGRGFAPFGSDDPLVRPFTKFPVNHHHAQLLERLVAIGAVRVGPLTGEVGTFNGDEPLGPGAEPRWGRFGDSWATRLTWRPARALSGVGALEVSGSFAAVRSPEDPDRIIGLDQRKWHAGVRLERPTRVGTLYALGEWAYTTELDEGRPVFRYRSVLGEAALCGRRVHAALRLERTDRHEATRLEDLFRIPVPHDDVSIIGMTRWSTATVRLGTAPWTAGMLRATPFVEGTLASPEDRIARAAFQSHGFYGSRQLWLLSTGVRLGVGAPHARMGRYGAATASAASHVGTHPAC